MKIKALRLWAWVLGEACYRLLRIHMRWPAVKFAENLDRTVWMARCKVVNRINALVEAKDLAYFTIPRAVKVSKEGWDRAIQKQLEQK